MASARTSTELKIRQQNPPPPPRWLVVAPTPGNTLHLYTIYTSTTMSLPTLDTCAKSDKLSLLSPRPPYKPEIEIIASEMSTLNRSPGPTGLVGLRPGSLRSRFRHRTSPLPPGAALLRRIPRKRDGRRLDHHSCRGREHHRCCHPRRGRDLHSRAAGAHASLNPPPEEFSTCAFR